jgi:hypothetical protein
MSGSKSTAPIDRLARGLVEEKIEIVEDATE